MDPNRPGPDRIRFGTDPSFFKYLYRSKILRSERYGPDKIWPKPDPNPTRRPGYPGLKSLSNKYFVGPSVLVLQKYIVLMQFRAAQEKKRKGKESPYQSGFDPIDLWKWTRNRPQFRCATFRPFLIQFYFFLFFF